MQPTLALFLNQQRNESLLLTQDCHGNEISETLTRTVLHLLVVQRHHQIANPREDESGKIVV